MLRLAMETSLRLVKEAYRLASRCEDVAALANCLNQLGALARFQGQPAEAEKCYLEALALGEKHHLHLSKLLNNLGTLYRTQARHTEAAVTLQRALALSRAAGDQWAVAMRLNNLGLLALDQQNVPLAQQYMTESAEIFQQIGAEQNRAACTKLLICHTCWKRCSV